LVNAAMITGRHIGSAIRLPALFAAVAVIPLAALGWFGWRLLEQDRAIENQRARDRLEDTATLVSHEIDRELARWEELLATGALGASVDVPANAVILAWDARGIERRHGIALPYYPAVAPPPELRSALLEEAEAQEMQEKDLAKAAASYRRLASTTNRHLRALALVRLARCLRNDRRIKEALDVYEELQAMPDVAVAGTPAALHALNERATLFASIGEAEAAKQEAASLASAVWEGRYVLDRATFDFYTKSAPPPSSTASDALRMAEAVEQLWSKWQQAHPGPRGLERQ
jgi:predicted negative regulator of RcsB-dependent stress response